MPYKLMVSDGGPCKRRPSHGADDDVDDDRDVALEMVDAFVVASQRVAAMPEHRHQLSLVDLGRDRHSLAAYFVLDLEHL